MLKKRNNGASLALTCVCYECISIFENIFKKSKIYITENYSKNSWLTKSLDDCSIKKNIKKEGENEWSNVILCKIYLFIYYVVKLGWHEWRINTPSESYLKKYDMIIMKRKYSTSFSLVVHHN